VLPAHVSARIAAGEVVERPASVVKELIENAVDSGACRVSVSVPGEPSARIDVADDGCGIPRDELAAAFCRHATSKLPGDDVLRIDTLGFRGEALPSIATFASVRMSSRSDGDDMGWEVTAEADGVTDPKPNPIPRGTRVEVRDLFRSHPARLKNMKARKTEMANVREAFDGAALARPGVEFRLETAGTSLHYPARSACPSGRMDRIADVMGPAFAADCLAVSMVAAGVEVAGGACVPTRSRRDASQILTFVNGRPVASRALASAVRAAYAGLLRNGEHPCAVVMVEVAPEAVDVNVHPRKSEVRFRDEATVCGAVTEAIRKAVSAQGLRTTASLGELAAGLAVPVSAAVGDRRRLPLGRLVGQCNGAWLIAETMDGFVIVDQHAAHERVILERLKASLASGEATSRVLPSPVLVRMTVAEAAALSERHEALEALGYRMDILDDFAVARAVPAALGTADPVALVAELARNAVEDPYGSLTPEAQADALSTAACHAAIRAGDLLDPDRADRLLREIEATPNAAQCNHGRPTAVYLTSDAIERLFGRR
jgi:DNA mismatch repair protein MutL